MSKTVPSGFTICEGRLHTLQVTTVMNANPSKHKSESPGWRFNRRSADWQSAVSAYWHSVEAEGVIVGTSPDVVAYKNCNFLTESTSVDQISSTR